jgi:hypothetical protein
VGVRVTCAPGRDSTFGKFRNMMGAIVNYGPVSTLIAVLIVVNALILGALTFDLDDNTKSALEILNDIILVIFTVEFSSQLLYLGLALFQNGFLGWNPRHSLVGFLRILG